MEHAKESALRLPLPRVPTPALVLLTPSRTMGMLELTKTIWDLTKWRPPMGLAYTITLRPSGCGAEVFVTLSNQADDLLLITVDRPPGSESLEALSRIAEDLCRADGLSPSKVGPPLVIDTSDMGIG